MIKLSLAGVASIVLMFASMVANAEDLLPSWNEGATKSAIIEFVNKVTTEGSPDFVPEPERIATFDTENRSLPASLRSTSSTTRRANRSE